MLSVLLDSFRQGGWIMWPILGVSFVVWFTGLFTWYRYWYIGRARKRFIELFKNGLSSGRCSNTVGYQSYDSLLVECFRKGYPSCEQFKAVFREFLLRMTPELNFGLDTMAAWIAVAPLLGLLGTVAGMIKTFEVITLFGVGNPGLMAEGISVALLTTEAGLTVAFPALLLHSFLVNRRKKLKMVLFSDGESIYNLIEKNVRTTQ